MGHGGGGGKKGGNGVCKIHGCHRYQISKFPDFSLIKS